MESSEAKQVETLAKKLKVSESQVIRLQQKTYNTSLWLQTLKNKQDET